MYRSLLSLRQSIHLSPPPSFSCSLLSSFVYSASSSSLFSSVSPCHSSPLPSLIPFRSINVRAKRKVPSAIPPLRSHRRPSVGHSSAASSSAASRKAAAAGSSFSFPSSLRPELIEGLRSVYSITAPTEIQALACKYLLSPLNPLIAASIPPPPSSALSPSPSFSLPSLPSPPPLLLASQTGSGKTLAYLLPLLELLKRDEAQGLLTRPERPRAVILVPSRDLAEQVLRVAKSLSHFAKLRAEALRGGKGRGKQMKEIDTFGGVDLLVSSPGALVKALNAGVIKLTDCKYFFIDEADTMMAEHNGFLPLLTELITPIRERIDAANKHRAALPASSSSSSSSSYVNLLPCQFLLCTASVPSAIEGSLSSLFPLLRRVEARSLHRLSPQLVQQFVTVGNQNKLHVLLELLKQDLVPVPPTSSSSSSSSSPSAASSALGPSFSFPPTLIFCNTVASVRAVYHFLSSADASPFSSLGVSCYHGEQTADERSSSFSSFFSGLSSVLVASDLGSRGLDTSFVSHVVQFDMALNPVDYLHRVGRTARAQRGGKATALVTKGDRVLAGAIKRAAEKGEAIDKLSSDKEAYKQEKEQEPLPPFLRKLSRTRPLLQKLGIEPARVSNSAMEKEKRMLRKKGLPDTVGEVNVKLLGRGAAQWDRYKSHTQRLSERLIDHMAKERRLFEDSVEFKQRVFKLSKDPQNKSGRKKSGKNDRFRISKKQVQQYYKQKGLGKRE